MTNVNMCVRETECKIQRVQSWHCIFYNEQQQNVEFLFIPKLLLYMFPKVKNFKMDKECRQLNVQYCKPNIQTLEASKQASR